MIEAGIEASNFNAENEQLYKLYTTLIFSYSILFVLQDLLTASALQLTRNIHCICMGGDMKAEDNPFAVPRTMVLVGRTGNGKSATANAIFGFKAFESKRGSEVVTRTTLSRNITLTNGQAVNVIDTPGLFNNSLGYDYISQEIVKCIKLARDGIDAVLLVYSIKCLFSEEEEAVFHSLKSFFGPKITDYMVVIFTGGDDLEEDESLEDYLNQGCAAPLQKILQACKNRCVLFDNKTKDERKKEWQLQQLMSVVENVMEENKGCPYTNNLFAEYEEAALLEQKKEEANASEEKTREVTEQMEKLQISHDEQLKRVTEMIEEKLKATNELLMQQLVEEKLARERADEAARNAQKEVEEIAEQKRHWEKRAHSAEGRPNCSIM